MRSGSVFDVQRCSFVDGPGIRTTVFLKGCNLACAWCHNPESQSPSPQVLFYESLCSGCGACAAACPAGACGEILIDRGRCTGLRRLRGGVRYRCKKAVRKANDKR